MYLDLVTQRLTASQDAFETLGAEDVEITERLSDLAVLFGDLEAVDNLLAGLEALFKGAGNRYGADYISLKRIHLALQRGLLRQAYALLQEMQTSLGDILAIEFSPAGLRRWEAGLDWPDTDEADRAQLFFLSYFVFGSLLAGLGQYGEALVSLRQGLFQAGKGAPDLAPKALVPTRLQIAAACLEKGDLKAAQIELDEIKPHLDALRQPAFSAQWLEISGKLSLLQGEFGKALERFNTVLELCRKGHFQQAELRASLNLAHISVYLNQTSAAKDLLSATQRRAEKLGDEAFRARVALLLQVVEARGHSLADGVPLATSVFEMWKGSENAAAGPVRIYQRDLPQVPQSANYLAFFEDRALGFHWQIGRGDFVAAANLLADLQEVFKDTDSILIRNRLKALNCLLAYYQGDYSNAERELEALRPIFHKLALKPELWQIQRVLGWCKVKLERPAKERESLRQDTEHILAAMTSSLQGADRAIFQLNKWTDEEENLAAKVDKLIRLRLAAQKRFWFKRLSCRWQIMKEINELIRDIDRHRGLLHKRIIEDRGGIGKEVSIPPLWRRLLGYPRRRATLAFLVFPDRTFIFSRRRFSLDFGISAITRIQVRNLVKQWYYLSQNQSWTRDLAPLLDKRQVDEQEENRRWVAEQLANILQIPQFLRSLPKRIKSLSIIPDDSLHGFPFAAIIHADEYLVKRYAISIGFLHGDQQQEVPESGPKQALLVGVSRGVDRFPPLHWVGEEVKQVRSWFLQHSLDPCTLEDDLAQKSKVLDCLCDSNYFHIACHGTFEPDRPDSTGMVLIPKPSLKEIISLKELSQLDLTKLQQVTLSSCWSADYFILPGRWINSLPETFWRSGAQSILASLWPVDDQLAVAFMKRFYDLLDELPRDKALRHTQLECLDGNLPGCEDLDITSPINWAGFQLYGRWDNLSV
jgi:CHAT domain-containing protein